MQRFTLAWVAVLILAAAPALQGAGGQYRVLKTLRVGGESGFDHVNTGNANSGTPWLWTAIPTA